MLRLDAQETAEIKTERSVPENRPAERKDAPERDAAERKDAPKRDAAERKDAPEKGAAEREDAPRGCGRAQGYPGEGRSGKAGYS